MPTQHMAYPGAQRVVLQTLSPLPWQNAFFAKTKVCSAPIAASGICPFWHTWGFIQIMSTNPHPPAAVPTVCYLNCLLAILPFHIYTP